MTYPTEPYYPQSNNQWNEKAQPIWQGASSALAVLCARAAVDCDQGIAVHGFSQGAGLASLAAQYDSRVSAALLFGIGTCVLDESSCAQGNGVHTVLQASTQSAYLPINVRCFFITPCNHPQRHLTLYPSALYCPLVGLLGVAFCSSNRNDSPLLHNTQHSTPTHNTQHSTLNTCAFCRSGESLQVRRTRPSRASFSSSRRAVPIVTAPTTAFSRTAPVTTSSRARRVPSSGMQRHLMRPSSLAMLRGRWAQT